MIFKKPQLVIDDYLKDWPSKYFQIPNKELKLACLNAILTTNPNSTTDLRRLEVYNLRYKTKGMIKDNFFYAVSMLKALSKTTINFVNRNRLQKEIIEYLKLLGVLDFEQDDILISEWQAFCKEYIEIAANSRHYRTTLLGLKEITDNNVIMRIANDIVVVTYKVPKLFYLDNDCLKFKEIFEATFINLVDNGLEILNKAKRI